MTQIEITDINGLTVTAAYYYPIDPADFVPGSEDPDREPAGIRLSPEELEALRAGTLYEWVLTINRPGTTDAIKNVLENRYNAERNKALREYSRVFSGIGMAFDGSVWT